MSDEELELPLVLSELRLDVDVHVEEELVSIESDPQRPLLLERLDVDEEEVLEESRALLLVVGWNFVSLWFVFVLQGLALLV